MTMSIVKKTFFSLSLCSSIFVAAFALCAAPAKADKIYIGSQEIELPPPETPAEMDVPPHPEKPEDKKSQEADKTDKPKPADSNQSHAPCVACGMG